MVKYLVAPARMPDKLTWFKWEAYTTWLSGFSLLVLVYYLGADLYLIDKNVMELTAPMAAVIAFLSLAVAWLGYEALCRSPLGKHEGALALVGFVFLVALTYGFTKVFSGRGAFTQIGALIGTIMIANVFAIIIPNQKKVVADLIAGRTPDPALGDQGKQRSVHNNYLTLPVVFLMISNHYPLLYATRYNWLIVAIVLLIGRRFATTTTCATRASRAALAVGRGGARAVTIAWLTMIGDPWIKTGGVTPSFKTVEDIVLSRCSMCHATSRSGRGSPHRRMMYGWTMRTRSSDTAASSRSGSAIAGHAARQHHRDDRPGALDLSGLASPGGAVLAALSVIPVREQPTVTAPTLAI